MKIIKLSANYAIRVKQYKLNVNNENEHKCQITAAEEIIKLNNRIK